MPVNMLAVLVAGIVHMAIGVLWYSPLLFGNLWARLEGLDQSALKLGAKEYIIAFLTSLVTVFVLAMFMVCANARTPLDGAVVGIWAWLGFIATLLVGDVIFCKKPFLLFLIRNAYNLVALAVAGAVIAAL